MPHLRSRFIAEPEFDLQRRVGISSALQQPVSALTVAQNQPAPILTPEQQAVFDQQSRLISESGISPTQALSDIGINVGAPPTFQGPLGGIQQVETISPTVTPPGGIQQPIALQQPIMRTPELQPTGGEFVGPQPLSDLSALSPVAPPTGLIGSEQALQAGLTGALGELGTSGQQALQFLGGAATEARQQLATGRADLQQGQQQGLQAIREAIGQGVAPLQRFVEPGQQAFDVQAALSGALGQEAQQQAFQAFTESPEQAFLREQGQRQVLAGAAATGGLGSGEVQRELTRFGTGLAAQDLQNRFGRLGAVSSQGLQAAGQTGQLRGQQAGLSSNLINALTQGRANLARQGAGLAQQFGQTGTGILGQLGINRANLLSGTAGTVAAGRLGTGQNIAEALRGATGNLANLQQIGGAGLSDILASGITNVAQLESLLGRETAQDLITRAQFQSNIATGTGSQIAGIQATPLQQSNTLGQLGQLASGVGGVLTAFNRPTTTELLSQADLQSGLTTINTGSQFGGFS